MFVQVFLLLWTKHAFVVRCISPWFELYQQDILCTFVQHRMDVSSTLFYNLLWRPHSLLVLFQGFSCALNEDVIQSVNFCVRNLNIGIVGLQTPIAKHLQLVRHWEPCHHTNYSEHTQINEVNWSRWQSPVAVASQQIPTITPNKLDRERCTRVTHTRKVTG